VTHLYKQMVMITKTISNTNSSTKPTIIPAIAPTSTDSSRCHTVELIMTVTCRRCCYTDNPTVVQ